MTNNFLIEVNGVCACELAVGKCCLRTDKKWSDEETKFVSTFQRLHFSISRNEHKHRDKIDAGKSEEDKERGREKETKTLSQSAFENH